MKESKELPRTEFMFMREKLIKRARTQPDDFGMITAETVFIGAMIGAIVLAGIGAMIQ